jgi:enamine deaminase RidA (YjgF/YER057c/UK114 family)
MAGRIDARLQELGVTLPRPMAPIANYVPYVITGDLVVISGQVPAVDGKIEVTGRVSLNVTIDEGKAAARQCFINVLAQLKVALGGDLDRVQQVVRLGGFIAAPAEFTGHAQVMNGASDLAVAVFGDAGRHARTTVGVPSLPADAAVEVEGMFRIAAR